MSSTSQTPAFVPPKPAASIMLIRDGLDGLEVLMMRRSEHMAFAPGAFVFPGGKVDKDDLNVTRWRRHVTSSKRADFGFRLAALRELYEEAGILLMAGGRRTTPRQSCDFMGLVRRTPGSLDTASLVPFAQWITPEGLPRRYDTYFYLAPLMRAGIARADGLEATEVRWVSPHRLLEEWSEQSVPLMFPTRLNLMKLARARSVRQAMQHARTHPPVQVLPKITMDGKARSVTIPKEAGFGVTAATPKELMVEAPARRRSGTRRF